MNNPQDEWTTLCREASAEQDPKRLMTLARRILELLEAKVSSKPDEPVRPAASNDD